jgi:hypothetical protein
VAVKTKMHCATLPPMLLRPLVPDDNRKPSSARWQQWGTLALFGIAVIVIVLILIGVTARKPWFWGLF